VKQQSKSEIIEKKSKKTEEKVTTPKQETKVQKAQKVEQSTPNVELREEKIKSDKRQKEVQEPQPQYFEMTLEK
jgi:IS5 family transposase